MNLQQLIHILILYKYNFSISKHSTKFNLAFPSPYVVFSFCLALRKSGESAWSRDESMSDPISLSLRHSIWAFVRAEESEGCVTHR